MNATNTNNELQTQTFFTALNDQQLLDIVLKSPKLIECMKSTLSKADEDILWYEITENFNKLQNNSKFTCEIVQERWKVLRSSLATNKHLFANRHLTTEMKIALENISAETAENNEKSPDLNKPQLLLESKIPFIRTMPVEQLHALEQEIYEMLIDYELEAKAEWRQIKEYKMEQVVKECETIFKELHIHSKAANNAVSENQMTNMDSANLVEAVLHDNVEIAETAQRNLINMKNYAVIKVPLAEANKYIRNFSIRLKRNYGDQYYLRRLRPRRTLN